MTMIHLDDHEPIHDEYEADSHDLRPGAPCFGCWCYSCGGRTDRPNLRDGALSHETCFA